jgi:hypothetical protein
VPELRSASSEARRRAGHRTLLIAGVEPQSATTPVDPPFTPDDLLAFHELLATDDWFDHLLRADAAG